MTTVEASIATPSDITARDRLTLLQEFDAGRGHPIFYFTLKLVHAGEVPWAFFMLGSADKDDVDFALDMLLGSDDPHPRVVELNQEPLRSQAELWRRSPRDAIFGDNLLEL